MFLTGLIPVEDKSFPTVLYVVVSVIFDWYGFLFFVNCVGLSCKDRNNGMRVLSASAAQAPAPGGLRWKGVLRFWLWLEASSCAGMQANRKLLAISAV